MSFGITGNIGWSSYEVLQSQQRLPDLDHEWRLATWLPTRWRTAVSSDRGAREITALVVPSALRRRRFIQRTGDQNRFGCVEKFQNTCWPAFYGNPNATSAVVMDNVRPVIQYLVVIYRRIDSNLALVNFSPTGAEFGNIFGKLLTTSGCADHAARGILQAMVDVVGFAPLPRLRTRQPGAAWVPVPIQAQDAQIARRTVTAGAWEGRVYVTQSCRGPKGHINTRILVV